MGGAYDYAIQPEANIQSKVVDWFFIMYFDTRNDLTCTILFWLLFLLLLLLVAATFPAEKKTKFFFVYALLLLHKLISFLHFSARDQPYTTLAFLFIYDFFIMYFVDTYWNSILIVRQTFTFFFFLSSSIYSHR